MRERRCSRRRSLPWAWGWRPCPARFPIPWRCSRSGGLPAQAFGTLMSLEPAAGALMGLMLLHEHFPSCNGCAIGTVVLASMGTALSVRSEPIPACRTSRRPSPPPPVRWSWFQAMIMPVTPWRRASHWDRCSPSRSCPRRPARCQRLERQIYSHRLRRLHQGRAAFGIAENQNLGGSKRHARFFRCAA